MLNVKTKSVLTGVFAISQILMVTGCSSSYAPDPSSSTALNTNQNALASSMQLAVLKSGTQIYSDSSGASATIALTAGQSYTFRVSAANLPAGATLNLQSTNVDSPNGAITNQSLQVGDNNFSPSVAGDYAFKIQINSGGKLLAVKNYQAAIVCSNPSFTANTLNPAGILVTANGANNLFDVSAPGITSSANGQAPYTCAYDLTGVGIKDTAFYPCATVQSKQYINYVANRKIGVLVKDACNTTWAVTANPAIHLAYSVPAMGVGNVFIFGQVSNESGAAASDLRFKGVTYLGTNENGMNPVQPSYGGSSFTINSNMNYGQAASVTFGMQVKVLGLGGSFNLTNNINGTIDTSAATLAVQYNVDQAGDQLPATTMSSASCTTTGIHAQVLTPVGTPCTTSSNTGSNNKATVEVWGDYICQMQGPAGTVQIAGEFDGLQKLVDSCHGGGGGGGGVPPVAF